MFSSIGFYIHSVCVCYYNFALIKKNYANLMGETKPFDEAECSYIIIINYRSQHQFTFKEKQMLYQRYIMIYHDYAECPLKLLLSCNTTIYYAVMNRL